MVCKSRRVRVKFFLSTCAVSEQSGDDFEIGATEHALDLLQLEPQLPVEEDLLQRQQLLLLVEPVAVRAAEGRLQQAGLVVKMQGTHAHARHRGQLFDGVCHRSSPVPVPGLPS